MPRSFLVKQQEKAQEPPTSDQDQKTVSQHGLGSPPPLLKISPRRSPSLQRTSVAPDNSRPIPKLVKIGDTAPSKKSLTEQYQTSIKLEEQRGINESLTSTRDLRIRSTFPMTALSQEYWTSQDPESRIFMHSSYLEDYRLKQLRHKNVGHEIFDASNSFSREQGSFYSHQQTANHMEMTGKTFAAPLFSARAGEGTYYEAHGTLIGPKGGIYPNPPLYSNLAFYRSKENESSSHARQLQRCNLPRIYPNLPDQDPGKDFRTPFSYAETKATEEPKVKTGSDVPTSTTSSNVDAKLQGTEFNQSGAPTSNVDVTASKASVSNGENSTKSQASNVKKYRYTCDVCGKSFSRSNTLTTHKRIHTGDKPFHCEQCGRAFRQPGNLTRHRLTHTAVKPYVCPQCNKAFNRASNLHTHMRTHTNYKPFVCDFCGKGFHQKIDMKIHRYTHTGEKPHKCAKCGRGFKQLTHLTYHMRTHSDERLYKCEYCGKGFNQKGNLQAHIYGHTGERPFKCDICDKGFTLASTLNTHKRTHAMKKPFECQFCGKAFYQKNALKTHYIASHPFANGVSLL